MYEITAVVGKARVVVAAAEAAAAKVGSL